MDEEEISWFCNTCKCLRYLFRIRWHTETSIAEDATVTDGLGTPENINPADERDVEDPEGPEGNENVEEQERLEEQRNAEQQEEQILADPFADERKYSGSSALDREDRILSGPPSDQANPSGSAADKQKEKHTTDPFSDKGAHSWQGVKKSEDQILADTLSDGGNPSGSNIKIDEDLLFLLENPNINYSCAKSDHKEFKKLFKSGKIIRTDGVYRTPEECKNLYDIYKDQLKNVDLPYLQKIPMAERVAIRAYTHSSEELNEGLRNLNYEKIKEFAPFIKTLLSGLNRVRAYPISLDNKGTPLRRGLRLSEDDIARLYVVGEVVTERAFVSCASDGKSGHSEPDLRQKFNVQINIGEDKISKKYSAKQLNGLSLHFYENESLYPPGTKFKVLEVKLDKNQEGAEPSYPFVDIYMEEIQSVGPM